VRRLRLAVCALALLLGHTAGATAPGEAAPDFALTNFDGHPLHLADLRGKLVLLNFWASWCGPCLEEMPRFSAWQRSYGAAGLQVIGVSMDDEAGAPRRYLAKHPVAYPIVLGDAKLGERYGGILGLPQSFLIDRRGVVLARFKGDADPAQIEAAIKAQLHAP